jgi:putative transposase
MGHRGLFQRFRKANPNLPMTHQPNPDLLNTVLQLLTTQGTSALAEGLRLLLNEAMSTERSAVLQAGPYERNSQRLGYANGFKPKHLATRVGDIELAIPQVRGDVAFYPSSLEKGVRSEQALLLAMAEMYVQGVSTRKVTKIVEELCGHQVSSTQVSQCAAKLDVELQLWRDRPLGACPYLVIDARYEKVRHGGVVVDCAVLIAIGVGPDGKRTVLGVSAALSEGEAHWRNFLASLLSRGLHGVKYIVSDAHSGLMAARQAIFPSVPWQRCQAHLQRNAQAYVPRVEMRASVGADIRSIFNCCDLASAQARLNQLVAYYAKAAPKLAVWMETTLPQGFTCFILPEDHRIRMRTSNAIERVNQELKRRTRVASIFPNETSLLRLVTALLCEQSNEWMGGKIYLQMDGRSTQGAAKASET